nr:hypothetical protein Q903MT_gene911 [Picea sitchensis]
MKQVTQKGNMHIFSYTMHSTWLGNTIDQTNFLRTTNRDKSTGESSSPERGVSLLHTAFHWGLRACLFR